MATPEMCYAEYYLRDVQTGMLKHAFRDPFKRSLAFVRRACVDDKLTAEVRGVDGAVWGWFDAKGNGMPSPMPLDGVDLSELDNVVLGGIKRRPGPEALACLRQCFGAEREVAPDVASAETIFAAHKVLAWAPWLSGPTELRVKPGQRGDRILLALEVGGSDWIMMTPDQADALAALLVEQATLARGTVPK